MLITDNLELLILGILIGLAVALYYKIGVVMVDLVAAAAEIMGIINRHRAAVE